MALVKFDPFDIRPSWGRSMRDIWPDFWEDTDISLNIPVEVKENKDNVIVKATVPGVNPEDLDVEVTSDSVSINYETKKEKEDKNERVYTCERMYGAFSRSVSLPTAVDTSKVESKFKHGILTLVLPKKEEVKPKKVKVSVK